MSKFKLVISDVDGTLVTKDKALRPRSVEAVRKLHERGIGFSICSSRPPFGLTMMIEPLGLTLPIGGYNAGAIVETDLTVIEQKLIGPDAAKKAVGIFHEFGIDCWVFDGDRWIVTNRQGDHVDHEIHTIQTPPTVVPAFTDDCFGAVGKIVGASDDHDRVARVEKAMQQALAGSASAARSQPYYCDVIPPGINKGRIVEVLAARLGIDRSEVAVRWATWTTTSKCSPRPAFRSRWAMPPTRSRPPPAPSLPAQTTGTAGPTRSSVTCWPRNVQAPGV